MSSTGLINLKLRAVCKEGRLKEAVQILLNSHNPPVDSSTYLLLLQICIAKKALAEGKQIHSHLKDNHHRGFTFATYTSLQNKLISMYDKCGSLEDARFVFDHMTERDVLSWSTMFSAYRKHGVFQEVFVLFNQMLLTGGQSDEFTFSTVLAACANMVSLKQGLQLHGKIIRCGFQSDIVVMNTLLDIYTKCGSIREARQVFDEMPQRNVGSWNAMNAGYAQNGDLDEASRLFEEMPQRDVVSWNGMIVGYAQNGFVDKALEILKQMKLADVKPNTATFASVLPACGEMGTLKQGMEIHHEIMKCGFLSDVVVATALIDMYAKCGNVPKARKLFDKMPQRNVVSWNVMIVGYAQSGNLDEALRLFKKMPQGDVVSWTAIIAGYAQNGLVDKALEVFNEMRLASVRPNSATFASILKACAEEGALEQGMKMHTKITESEFLSDAVVVTALIDMYAKCGSMQKAKEVFDNTPQRCVATWNAMIAGYVQNGFLDEAWRLFEEMPLRDVVSWTAIIDGYAQHGLVQKALEVFEQMQSAGVKPNSATIASIMPVCAKMGALEQGIGIHQRIMESGLLSDVVVVTALIDMYAKCGSIHKARQLFDKMQNADVISWTAMITGYIQIGSLDEALGLFKEMPERNVVSWTVIIAGYAQNELADKALEFFKKMQLTGLKPDSSTFASILPACAKRGVLEQGMDIHQKIIKSGFLSDAVAANALIDMYAKCGNIEKGQKLFDKIHLPDVPSWNAMIAGYAMHGYSNDALKLFELMNQSGTNPDHITFISVLFTCSHAGLVNDGCHYFNHMRDSYYVMPTMDHYACMIDILGRAGYLEEALNFIIKMPMQLDAVVWMSLLSSCRSQKNLRLGEYVARLLLKLDSKDSAPYVLLSNIYAEAGKWGDVQNVRKLMKNRGIKKTLGCSWIEVHKIVHAFSVGDRSHPQTKEIYAKLEKLSWEMKAAGYIPDKKYVLNDVEEEEKELLLCHHSEKLAIAFGLLYVSSGTTIRVVKNLRICDDCHTATKFISKIAAREIVIRDAKRFHHFKHGQCSCGDYW